MIITLKLDADYTHAELIHQRNSAEQRFIRFQTELREALGIGDLPLGKSVNMFDRVRELVAKSG